MSQCYLSKLRSEPGKKTYLRYFWNRSPSTLYSGLGNTPPMPKYLFDVGKNFLCVFAEEMSTIICNCIGAPKMLSHTYIGTFILLEVLLLFLSETKGI